MAGATSANWAAGTTETNGALAPSTEAETVRSGWTDSNRGISKLICRGLAYVNFAGRPLTLALVPHSCSAEPEVSSRAVQFARPLPSKEADAPGAKLGDQLPALSTAIDGLPNPSAIR